MFELLCGDAWLVGRVTGQEFAEGDAYPDHTDQTYPREPWFARRDADAYGVVLDAHCRIAWGRSDIGGDPIVAVLTKQVSDAPLAGLRKDGVSYNFAGEQDLDLGLALDILNRQLGVKRLLVEGGGGANGSFLRAGLIDELSLVICPAVDGAKAWSRFRAVSLPAIRPVIAFITIILVIGAFNVFISVFLVTNGGPLDETQVLLTYMYREAFSFLDFGYGSAISFTLTLLVFALSLVQLRLFRRRSEAV